MKLGMIGQLAGGKSLVGKAEKGLKADGKGEGPEGAAKGEALTEDGGLLAGLGYNTVDRRTSAKNVAERANLERFLKEMGGEDVKEGPKQAKGEEAAKEKRGDAETKAEPREAKEAAQDQPRAEARREGAEDGRVQGQAEAHEAQEAHEAREPQEAEAEHQGGRGRDEEDEQDKPGAGWVAEELEDKSDEEKVALRSPDALMDAHRCRGHLEDGGRCLRRVVKGSHYCREHFVPLVPTPPRA